MLICVDCKKELQCIKTGISVRYRTDGTHVYAGDLYECSLCKIKIANYNDRPHFDKDVMLSQTPNDIWMDNDILNR